MGDALFGDFSEFQGVINWNLYTPWSARGDGLARVGLRAGQGVGVPDRDYQADLSGARASGIQRTYHYWYAYPNLHPGTAGAQVEAASFLSTVAGHVLPGDRLMLDLEQNEQSGWAAPFGLALRAAYPSMAKPVLYDSLSHIQAYLQDPELPGIFDLAVADWTFDPDVRPAAPAPWSSYLWLQFSDRLIIPGIAGPADADIFVGSDEPAPKGTHSDMAILQHPVDNGRLDLVWIQNSDGRILHTHNNSDGMAGLFTEASGADFGIPPEPAVEVQASFSNNGQSINCIVIGQSGQWYGRSFNTFDESPQNAWTPLHGVTSRVPVAAAGEPEAQKILAALHAAATALETGLS